MLQGQALDIVLGMARELRETCKVQREDVEIEAIEEVEYLLSIYDCDRDNYDEDEYWKLLHTYSPPFLIEFSEFDLQDQNDIFKSKLKLNGLSYPSDPDKGASNEQQYLSTCLFDVL